MKYVLIAIGLVAVGCGGRAATRDDAAQTTEAMTSARAGKLVYFRDTTVADGPNQVFLSDADGSNARAIAEGRWPDIDANGKQVAYIEGTTDLAKRKLVVRHLGAPHAATEEEWSVAEGTSPTFPDLSLDGKKLAVTLTMKSGLRKVAVLDLEAERAKGAAAFDPVTGRARYDATPVMLDAAGTDDGLVPSLSERGDFVVFVQRRPTLALRDADSVYDSAACGGVLVMASLKHGGDEKLFEGKCLWRPAVSPDGKSIAFEEAVSGIRGDTHIWSLDLATKTAHAVTNGMVEFEPNYAADGALLYSTIHFAEGHEDTAEIDALAPRATTGRALVHDGGPFLHAAISRR
jgi:hypothetical protein